MTEPYLCVDTSSGCIGEQPTKDNVYLVESKFILLVSLLIVAYWVPSDTM